MNREAAIARAVVAIDQLLADAARKFRTDLIVSGALDEGGLVEATRLSEEYHRELRAQAIRDVTAAIDAQLDHAQED